MAIISEQTRQAYPEGTAATTTAGRTAQKLPTDFFLWAAGAAIATSLLLKVQKRDHESLFVGQWAPTLLALGVYSKLLTLLDKD